MLRPPSSKSDETAAVTPPLEGPPAVSTMRRYVRTGEVRVPPDHHIHSPPSIFNCTVRYEAGDRVHLCARWRPGFRKPRHPSKCFCDRHVRSDEPEGNDFLFQRGSAEFAFENSFVTVSKLLMSREEHPAEMRKGIIRREMPRITVGITFGPRRDFTVENLANRRFIGIVLGTDCAHGHHQAETPHLCRCALDTSVAQSPEAFPFLSSDGTLSNRSLSISDLSMGPVVGGASALSERPRVPDRTGSQRAGKQRFPSSCDAHVWPDAQNVTRRVIMTAPAPAVRSAWIGSAPTTVKIDPARIATVPAASSPPFTFSSQPRTVDPGQ